MMTARIDSAAFQQALTQYVVLKNRDMAEVLKNVAGDLALRSGQAATAGRRASKPAIQNLWQGTEWTSKKPWQRGRDMWGLFISKLLASEGFRLKLGRSKAKTAEEKNVSWYDTVARKTRFGRRTKTDFRQVSRSNMKSSDWKRVSKRILTRRASRVGAFVGAFVQVAAKFGKSRFAGKRAWKSEVHVPTPDALFASFVVPIRGSKYPYRGDKSVPVSADAMKKEVILYGYMQQGVSAVLYDPRSGLVPYIKRKLNERARKQGLAA